ncbi:MAG: MBL fold metallo-hydrolase [Acidobacteria bacterium]|nr:MBL fold metallo-hydrolase [Acidobacteriota bacterium]
MRASGLVMMFAASCLVAVALSANVADSAPAANESAAEPLSKTYRVTRASDVEYQKIAPFKVFDNLYQVGPGYVSVWLLTTPQGHIVFDTAQEPFVDHVIANLQKVGVNLRDIKYILLSHGHLDHVGGAARLQEVTGARVGAIAEDWTMMEALDGKSSNRDLRPNRMPKRDLVFKDGDRLTLGNQTLKFHQTPGHTPGVLTTEGITVYDGGRPFKAIVMGGGGYRGGLTAAEQSVVSANKVAAIQGVQVNLQIHSWAEPDGYPGGGVLERSLLLANRKAGDPHPFVDPTTWTQRAKQAQESAANAVQTERQKTVK